MPEATIRDVARHADVSVASVSRALNGLANVHPDTRARVLSAAAALGYVPHAGARSLSLARTQAIGVVLPDLHGEFFSELVRGLDREVSARGYHLLLSNMHADPDLAAHALRSMRGRVDGLIVMAPQIDPDVLGPLLPRSLPMVWIASPRGSGRHALRIDNRGGAAAMVRHLAAQGRRAIVHIAGPAGNIDAQERRAGFEAEAAAHGIDAVTVTGDFTEASGEEAIAQLHAAGARYDAVFAANDMMALGALQALRRAGIAVPRVVAVAGFDDVPISRYLSLTTMQVRIAAMGEKAAARLVDAIERSDAIGPGETAEASSDELIVPRLLVRGSTAADSEGE